MKSILLILLPVILLSGCSRPNLSKPIKVKDIKSYERAVVINYEQGVWKDHYVIPPEWAGQYEVGKEYYIQLVPVTEIQSQRK
jgi:hypothetical protein